MKSRLTGKGFEKDIADMADIYATQGKARLAKVDPPSITFVPKGTSRAVTQLLENPWLDFAGSWTERAGRHILIEAKETTEPKIKLREKKGGGVSAEQIDAGLDWQAAGAMVLFLWKCDGVVRFMTPNQLLRAVQDGKRSLHAHECHRVPEGPGLLFYDFLAIARALAPEPKPNP